MSVDTTSFTDSAQFNAELDEARRAFADVLGGLSSGPAPRLEKILDIQWPKDDDPSLDTSRFRFQHVEYLIDQAADLLDRGMRDREAWAELQEKRFELAVALEEFSHLDEIQREEDSTGQSKKISLESRAKATAASEELKRLMSAEKTMSEAQTNLRNSSQQRQDLALWTMWVNLYNRNNEDIPNFSGISIEPHAGHTLPKIYNIAPTLGHLAGKFEVSDRAEYLATAVEVAASNSERAVGQKKAALLRADYDANDVLFQERKRQVIRNTQAAKFAAWKNKGGELNYDGRMKPIQDRFRNDFCEALARLLVAERGLKSIYGYLDPLPKPVDNYLLFDECLNWVRKAIHHVTAFNRTEQIFIAPLSVRNLVGDDDWTTGKKLKTPKWTLALSNVEGPRNALFGNTGLGQFPRYVRLRGAAVYVESSHGGTWRVNAAPPKTSFLIWKSNEKHDVAQADVPPLLALRARSRQHTFQTELLGASHLHNVAPFGNWEVSLDRMSVEGLDADIVDDIILDFYVIAQLAP
jgi:hypothetical protein